MLQARESLTRILETAAGTGSLKKAKQKDLMRDLRRAAEPRGMRSVDKPKTREQHQMMLASMGISMKEV